MCITSLVTGCNALGGNNGVAGLADGIGMPETIWSLPNRVDGFAPNAPAEYKQGWQDGCKTGISMYGTSIHKAFYKFTLDPELRDNTTYNRIWHNARSYCRSETNRFLAGNEWSSAYPGALSGQVGQLAAGGRQRNFQSVTGAANMQVFGIPLSGNPQSLNLFHQGSSGFFPSWGSNVK